MCDLCENVCFGGNMFYDNFIKLCAKKGESPNAVASKLGLSTGTVTWWKKGRMPREPLLYTIAEYFNVSVDFLLGKDTEKPKSNQHIFISYSNKGSEKENELGLNLNPDQTEKLKEILERFNKLPEDKQDDYLDMFEKMLKMNDK